MLRFMLRSPVYRFAAHVLLAASCTSGLFAQAPANAPGPVTAGEAIERIVKATGATPPANTVDTIKAGDPGTVVTGIATTFTPTMEVLRKAVAAGDNLIVTHEPTFYNHLDQTSAVYRLIRVYKEKHCLYSGASSGDLAVS